MLGRTAESLFWMSRQIERAENMARLAEVGFRISLIARFRRRAPRGMALDADERRRDRPVRGEIRRRLVRQGDQLPALRRRQSRPRCARASRSARTNARFVRTKITRDMWEAMNSTWLAYDALRPKRQDGGRAAGADRLDPAAHRALPRLAARHDPARRRLFFQPARRFRRARRQHRAHSRREVFHPAPEQPDDRRRGRHLSVGDDPALRLRRTAPTGTSSTRPTGRGTSPSS